MGGAAHVNFVAVPTPGGSPRGLVITDRIVYALGRTARHARYGTGLRGARRGEAPRGRGAQGRAPGDRRAGHADATPRGDRKSTRLNSSHSQISYAVFCLKKKK